MLVCMCVHVFVYTCMSARVCVCTYVYMYVCISVCVCVCVFVLPYEAYHHGKFYMQILQGSECHEVEHLQMPF